MYPIIFIEERIFSSYESALFELFSKQIQGKLIFSSTFSSYNKNVFPIFTNMTRYIANFIDKNSIKKYGIIIDYNDFKKNTEIDKIVNASFVYVIGNIDEKYINFFNKIKAKTFSRITIQGEETSEKYVVCEQNCIANLYEDIVANKITFPKNEKIYILGSTKATTFPSDIFKNLNISIEYIIPNPYTFALLLQNSKKIYYKNDLFIAYTDQKGSITDKNFYISLIKDIESCNIDSTKNTAPRKKINIVCFKPTYLFADLVKRFENMGCIHSDFPLHEADAYIWMRPQELWHYEYLLKQIPNSEIQQSYAKSFAQLTQKCSITELQKKSVAIHHGTCFDPLYQFCPTRLAQSLYNIHRVVGVCEFDECYGPSASIANKENFVFYPIGYDHTLFTESLIKHTHRCQKDAFKIGIVGRSYGTSDPNILAKSKLAEPYGYRKGGDLILDIALRLKALQLPFELHILGANWEELVAEFSKFSIPFVYYTRDKNITYKEFPHVYANFDVLFIASRCEGGPVSALEAMSLGIPVVSTDVGICRFLEKKVSVKNAITCFHYDRKWGIFDKKDALNKILKIYEEDTTLDTKMAIRKSIQEYTTDEWVKYIYNEAANINY